MAERIRQSRRKLIGFLLIALVATVGIMFASQQRASAADAAESTEAKTDTEAKDGERDDKAKAPVPVDAVVAERGSVAAYISTTANLVAENDVRVAAEVDGTIKRVVVEEGQWVAEGQVLAKLKQEDAEIALGKARAKAQNARIAFERAQNMRQKGVISKEDYDRVEMEHGVAVQEVAEAEWSLAKRTVRAPFAGRITERFVMNGQRIKPNDELFSIADYDPLVARIYLPEKEVFGLEPGRAVRIALNADDTVEFGGRIRLVSPIVDTATGTVKVTVEAVDPPKQVRPGGFVTVSIVRERHDDVVRVPREAVIRELMSAHVFVTDGETASKRKIVTGIEEGSLVEVVSGLDAGERVVTAGQGGLRDGTAVTILADEAVAEAEPDDAKVPAAA